MRRGRSRGRAYIIPIRTIKQKKRGAAAPFPLLCVRVDWLFVVSLREGVEQRPGRVRVPADGPAWPPGGWQKMTGKAAGHMYFLQP